MNDLWNPPPPQHNTPDMHRRNSPQTSIDASERVARAGLPELQQAVYAALEANGPMTDGELERLPQFSEFSPSTVRCRRKDLRDKGFVVDTGEVRAGPNGRSRMIVWAVKR